MKPQPPRDFRNRRVLVTGASSGIGEALALAFAAEGARLWLVARDAARLEAVRARCAALGAQATVHSADLTDEAAVQRLAAAVHGDGGALDVLVNNAGVVMGGLCWEVEAADWRRLHEINVMGVVHGILAFVPQMIAAGRGGAIVNMASVSGFVGARGMATYSASKFAVAGLTESLRGELHGHGIGVSLICPAFVKTPIQEKVKLVGSLDTPKARARIDRDFAKTSLTPEVVAARTLKAIRGNEAVVTVGRDATAARLLQRYAPALLERLLRGR
ncbi:MAG: SDR family NAD(P)-dependent oxidoreductase [Nevskia sp.]|uniref:SDR family NAD(P)-dependent oxidoreductase n=1 Tax=Nevskia sp. TaxID=1929292 RepID=UPI0040368223